MIKQQITYVLGFGALSFIGYFLHTTLLVKIANATPFPLISIYSFFGIFSLLLCCIFLLLAKVKKYKDLLGFLYLVSVVVKIVLFCAVFYKHIFNSDSLTNLESINLLIPMILMLFLKVIFIRKLLNNLSVLKNTK